MNPERQKVLQVVVGGLITGVALFALILAAIHPLSTLTQWSSDPIVWLLAGLSTSSVAASWTVVRWHDRATDRMPLAIAKTSEINAHLSERLQQRTILGCALLEAGVFLNLLGGVVWPNLLTLLTIPVMLALMSLYFPTNNRIERWFAARRQGLADQTLNR